MFIVIKEYSMSPNATILILKYLFMFYFKYYCTTMAWWNTSIQAVAIKNNTCEQDTLIVGLGVDITEIQ